MLFFYKSPGGLNRVLGQYLNPLTLILRVGTLSVMLLGTLTASRLAAQTCVKPNAGNDTTVCKSSAQLKVPLAGETWTFLSSNNGNTPSITASGLATGLTVTGQYKFLLKKVQDAACSDTVTVTKANFLIASLADYEICLGGNLTFGYQGLSNVTYQWSTNATGPTITVSPSQTTNYSVVVTSTNTGCAIADTAKVTVFPKPNAGKDTIVCGTTAKVSAAGSGESWSFLSFNDPADQGSTATATIDNQGNVAGLSKKGFYRFVLTNNTTDCTDTIRIQKPSFTLPDIQLNPICPGAEISFGYTNVIDFTYLWDFNNATTPQITVKPNVTTNYTVTVTSVQTQCSVKDTITVTVKPASVLTLVSSVCSPDKSTYTTTVTVTNGAVITSNAGVVSGSGTTFAITTGSDTTLYTITATLNNCRTQLNVNKPDCNNTTTCPTITIADATDSLCSGYYGEPIVVTVSDTSKIVRFVYFTTPKTGSSMYTGGTLIEEVEPQGNIVGAPNGLPGLQLPANSGTTPIKYYVYAVLKTPPTSSPNCFPFAEKVYTILPLPKFEMDSIPACTGDTTYKVNLSITSAGTFTVIVAASVASIGNGPIPGGITQTLNNVSGNGALTSLTLKTVGNNFIIVRDANGCASVALAPAPSFKTCNNNCPTITIADATDSLCSGYYGEPIVVTVSDTSKIVRFVYFTTPKTGSSMYTGGTLIEEVEPQGNIVGAPNGLPGLQLPANSGTTPIKYYVYAVLKTPPTSSPNCFPFAEKVYTILPLPKFEMDSIPACTGDTTYIVNLSITPAGTFTIYVASGVATIGNGPIPTGISQTLTNVQGGGQVKALTLKTTGNNLIVIQDANGCATIGLAPKPSFKPCEGVYDLALDKSISTKTAKVGDDITYTLKVWNEGQSTATNVSVKDTLSAGVQYVTFATEDGNYDAVSKIWTIGSLAPGDTAFLLLVVKVVAQGVWFNTAEICSMTEKDEDSTPCNGNDEEDDIDRECFSVPLEVCPSEAIQVAVPVQYLNVKWFKDGGAVVVATGNEILITDPGTYTFTATSNTCPAQGCCPIIVQPGSNCCPPDLCVPFIIKQTKKSK